MRALEVAEILGGSLKGDPAAEFSSVDDIKGCKNNILSFVSEAQYLPCIQNSGATVLLVEKNLESKELDDWCGKSGRACIYVDKAYKAFIKIIYKLHPELNYHHSSKHQTKMIADSASIAKDAVIYPNVFIGENVKIGARTVLYPGVVVLKDSSIGNDGVMYPNVSIYQNTKIGDRVTVGASSVIGSDGFGYIKDTDGTMIKVPHLGGVIIEDDVEVGSNTSIDRGTLGNTHIKKGTKVDNLVQIAHNCIVGENNILCGMVGLSGSTELGNNVIMAANSGTKGHIKIGDNCTVTALTNVSKDLKPGSQVKGIYPARPIEEELKIQVLVGKLPDLYERIKKIEKEIKK